MTRCTWYAVTDDGRVFATGATYLEASDRALLTGMWDMAPGSVAPYVITTIEPRCAEPAN